MISKWMEIGERDRKAASEVNVMSKQKINTLVMNLRQKTSRDGMKRKHSLIK